jgi:DNA-binding transcriptional LysR family regulator
VHLVDDHVDIAVRIGKLPDSTMVATQVGSMRTVVCASPGLLASQGVPKVPADLLSFPCVTIELPVPALGWRFRVAGAGAPVEISVRSRLSVTSTDAAVAAAVRGVGAARLLYYQVSDALQAGTLQIVLGSFEPEPAPVNLVHVARTQMPIKIRRFIDFAIPRLRTALNAFPAWTDSP